MTIFSKIVAGEIPCYKVGEDAENFAFLDINPLVEGHTLVVPKLEIDKFFDLTPTRLASLMLFAQKVARQIESKIDCKRVAVVVLGLDVAHAHIHLIPLNAADDIDFKREKLKLTDEQFRAIASKISI
ncbi:MAG: HIT family protein [Mucinivorans sp.]